MYVIYRYQTREYKIVIVTPAGRKHYLEILLKNLLKYKDEFSEWHLWNNTKNPEDILFLYELEKQYSWIKVINRDLKDDRGTSSGIYNFFDYTIDPNVIYIRLDDDIVYIHKDFIKNIVRTRLENPDNFLVYGNIVNNNIVNHIHYKNNVFQGNEKIEEIDYNCMGNLWRSGELANQVHLHFIQDLKNKNVDRWFFENWTLRDFERCSINAICWIGGSFNNFGKIVDRDEEQWLSCDYPKKINKPNIICGKALCAHAAFYPQRNEELERTIKEYHFF